MKTKQQKREEAAGRFKIMPFVKWCKERGHKDDDVVRPLYEVYVSRKMTEAISLGIRQQYAG